MADLHTNNGGYDDEGVIYHQHSNFLMKKIIEFFPKEIQVMDIGCGHNFYVTVLNHLGYKDAIGCDMVDLGSKYFFKKDVTEPFNKGIIKQKVNVISLEVGEHIPEVLASKYLDNITNFKGDVIMSWALPGQEGIGHINCQPNKWVIDEMRYRGFWIDEKKTEDLRNSVKNCHCNWFQNTLMYFTCE